MQADAWRGRREGARAEPLPRPRTWPGAGCARPSAWGSIGGATDEGAVAVVDRRAGARPLRGRDPWAAERAPGSDRRVLPGDRPGREAQPRVRLARLVLLRPDRGRAGVRARSR